MSERVSKSVEAADTQICDAADFYDELRRLEKLDDPELARIYRERALSQEVLLVITRGTAAELRQPSLRVVNNEEVA